MTKPVKITIGLIAASAILLTIAYFWLNRKPFVKVNLISPEEGILGIEINGEKKILKFDQPIKVNRNYSVERAIKDGSTVGVNIRNTTSNEIVETVLVNDETKVAELDGSFQ